MRSHSHRSHSPTSSSSSTENPKLISPPSASLSLHSSMADTCLIDLERFTTTLAAIKARGAPPALVASIIAQYEATWLPEFSSSPSPAPLPSIATWARRKLAVESLAAALPPERDGVPCGLVLRLLRAASMTGASAACVGALERQAARQLDEAQLGEVMIPAFSYASPTALDVGLMLRLVRGFAAGMGGDASGVGGMTAAARVARLVDEFLAEAAVDEGLSVAVFEELARALPAYARAAHDGLYRAIDTYIKAHPRTTKQERKTLSRLMDVRKLSSEASLHALHNERFPVRALLHLLLISDAHHPKLGRRINNGWSGPISGRCNSSPSMRESLAQQHELRRLREDVARLERQCQSLQTLLERLAEKKKKKKQKKKGFFRWSISFLLHGASDAIEEEENECDELRERLGDAVDVKKVSREQESVTPKWRRNSSA